MEVRKAEVVYWEGLKAEDTTAVSAAELEMVEEARVAQKVGAMAAD